MLKINGVYSGLRLILYPSSVEIRLVVFVQSCWQTNQPTNDDGRNQTSLVELITQK